MLTIAYSHKGSLKMWHCKARKVKWIHINKTTMLQHQFSGEGYILYPFNLRHPKCKLCACQTVRNFFVFKQHIYFGQRKGKTAHKVPTVMKNRNNC